MVALLHPCTHEWMLAARRWRVRDRRCWMVGAASIVLVAVAALVLPERVGAALQSLARESLVLLIVSAALAGLATRARLVALDGELRSGWWAAAPLSPRASMRTMVAVGCAATVLATGMTTLTLVVLAWWSGSVPSLPILVVATSTGIAAGAVAGTCLALRHRRRAGMARREGLRAPMFGLRWLDAPRLPHLHDWQRREALLRWRRGGNAWMVGAALFGIPGGAPLLMLPGLLLVTLALAWWLVVLDASRAVTREARRVLAATPTRARTLQGIALRYPGFALACALAMASAGIACLGMSWQPLATGATGALVLLAATLMATRGHVRT